MNGYWIQMGGMRHDQDEGFRRGTFESIMLSSGERDNGVDCNNNHMPDGNHTQVLWGSFRSRRYANIFQMS